MNYEVPDSCEDGVAFRAAVSERSPGFQWSDQGEPFTVVVTRTAHAYVGRAHFADGLERRVQADECGQVVQALALITAVTLESESGSPVALGQVDAAAAQGHPKVSGWRSRGGASAELAGGRGPELMPGLGLFADIGRQRGLWSPRGRATLKLGRRRNAGASNNLQSDTTFTFAGLHLEACPLSLGPAALCLGSETGVLRVTSQGPFSVGARNPWWLAGTAGLNVDVPAGVWVVQLRVGASVPFTRYRFVLERADESRDTVQQTTPAAFFAVAVGRELGSQP